MPITSLCMTSPAYKQVCYSGECSYVQITDLTPWGRIDAWIQTDAAPMVTGKDYYQDPPQDQHYIGTLVSVADPDGGGHQMGAYPGSGQTTQMRALDASGYYINTSNWSDWVIYDANGDYYDTYSGVIKDAIGNQMTAPLGSGGIASDTIGRSIPAPPRSGATCPNWTPWQVPGQNGGTVTYQVCFTQGAGELLLSQIKLPNGTYYKFDYETVSIQGGQGHILELSEIELPTGGSISYTWTDEQATCSSNWWRRVATRTLNDGDGHQWTWNYSRARSGNYNYIFTVTDPLGNVAVHTSTELGNEMCSIYETQYQQQDNASHTLRTVNTAYQWLPDQGYQDYTTYDVLAVAPTSVTTTLDNGAQTTTTKAYPANTFQFCDMAARPGAISCNNLVQYEGRTIYVANPSTVCVNDYGAGGGCTASTLQRTDNTYLAFQNGNYLNNNQLNLKSQVQVTSPLLGNGSTTNYYYDAGGGYKGLLTKIDKGLGAVYQKTYTGYGMLYQDIDPLSHYTTYSYDGTGLFLQSETNALNQVTQYNYDANTGVLNYEIDPNNQRTSYTYDELNRPLSVSYPDGGSTSYSYNDSPGTPSVQVTTAITSSQSKVEIGIVDGLGRLIQTQLNTDPEGVDNAIITYDPLGRKASVTNPYRSTSDPTYGVTQYQYDALNRLLNQTQPDGSAITYSYTGNQTTVKDEAQNARETQTNALGWLTNVWEAPFSYDYPTSYSYDGLGNLTKVAQSRTNDRTFAYDSLSRLTMANNPEAGPIHYGYDTTSTLISKTDNRGVTITYNPDALHRITSKSYSDGEPTIYYCFDNQNSSCNISTSGTNGVGRRTGMADASGKTAWWYDSMGRVTETDQVIAGSEGLTWYWYNLDGSLNEEAYPDGDDVQYQYSNAARPTWAAYDDFGISLTFVDHATYTPGGAVTGYQSLNYDGQVAATVANSYNQRLQPATMSGATPQGTVFSLSYNFNLGAGDNENVYGITNNLNANRSETFTYDRLNRLSTAGSTSSSWGDSYGYDSRGNLLSKTVTGQTGENWLQTFDGNNHLVGWGYDGSGNLVAGSGGPVVNQFNAEDQWTYQTYYNVTYLYDGDGNRVKASGGASGTRVFWYDVFGNVIEENEGPATNEYLYLGNQRITRVYNFGVPIHNSGTPYYYLGDNLQTTRVIVDENGNKCYDADYFPWGGEQQVYVNSCPQNYKFNGKERDPDMGVDYFGARFYRGDMARFYQPDWSAQVEPVPYAKMNNPQTLNLYTYVANNPLSFRDPNGHSEASAAMERHIKAETSCKQGSNGDVHCTVLAPAPPPPVVTTADLNPFNGRAPLAFQGFVNLFLNGQFMRGGTQLLLGLGGAAVLSGFSFEEAGEAAPSAGQVAQAERVLQSRGRAGVEKAIRSLEDRIAEHEAKLGSSQYTSSISRELRNFKQLLNAYKSVLEK